MNRDEINMIIAETCCAKWVVVSRSDGSKSRSLVFVWGGMPEPTYTSDMSLPVCQIHHLPDYCGDLNAMHEAEKFLDVPNTGSWIASYEGNLRVAMAHTPEARIGTLHATARQRAVAYSRTIGKWRDE